jgi:hypothetical protein
MIVTEANCPSCGAPIVFKLGSSIVVVCEYCNSAIARKDRNLADLGKVSDLVDTRSPLEIGTPGYFEGVPFTLTGRAQLRHPAGGIWDEWYAALEDGRWGWLAEAQGRFFMTFRRKIRGSNLLPTFDELRPGDSVVVPGSSNRFVVDEKDVATTAGARGEIPYELISGERRTFVDLSGDNAAFATIDYGEQPPALFVGREVTLRELRIFAEHGDELTADKRRVDVGRLICPKCNGPLELRAPDAAQRVTCPSCNALLDVEHGNLTFLESLAKGPPPEIPLGREATLPDGKLTVIGYMIRDCVVEGSTYAWEEYLLYAPQVGFRWLMRSDDHWVYMSPLAGGSVFDGNTSVSFRNKQYRLFNRVNARVRRVFGEFYWRVSVNDVTLAADFVRAPEMISKEASGTEVSWTHGIYLTKEAVEKAFRPARPLRVPKGVGPCQPNPNSVPWVAAVFLLSGALLLVLVFSIVNARRQVFAKSFSFPRLEAKEASTVLFSDPFDLAGRSNIRIAATAPVDNGWVFVEGDLVNDETGLVQAFSLPIELYSGVDGGDSWSEGSNEGEVFLSALPEGRYTMRLEAQWGAENASAGARGGWDSPMTVRLTVEQGVWRIIHLVVLLVILLVPLGIRLVMRLLFERRRWSDSMFNPYESSD